MKILQKTCFKKTVKKFSPYQKQELDQAIREIINNINIGELKKGNLTHIRVYKFKIHTQLFLLAYTYEAETIVLTLLAIGIHENFYRDL